MARRRLAAIKALADVYPGYSARPAEKLAQGPYRYLTGRNLGDLAIRPSERDVFVASADRPSFQRSVVRAGDILVSTLFEDRKLYVCKTSDPAGVAGSGLAIIRPREGTLLADYLNTSAGREQFLKEATRKTKGALIPTLTTRAIEEIRLPSLTEEEIQKLAEAQLSLVGNELRAFISRGEGTKMEFKATLRRNLYTRENDSKMEFEVLRTVAAFCNTDGGILLIGVDDDGTIRGIADDGFPNSDKFLLHLANLLRGRLEPSPHASVKPRIVVHGGRQVCVVECEPTQRDIWVRPESGAPELLVRVGPSSKVLLGPEITEYYRTHFMS